MKYNVGDKVRIKSLDWYNRYTNGTEVDCGAYPFTSDMKEFCGQERIIANVCQECYVLLGIDDKFVWTDEMIEGLVEEEKLLCEGCCSLELKYNKLTIADNICTDKVEVILQDYELKKEGDKWFAVKKKKEYPKTFEECVHVLEGENRMSLELMNTFRKLIDARNAYWKIVGEEMGLGKPWEPDYLSDNYRYCIVSDFGKIIKNAYKNGENNIFAFPTEEMRDAFYENFKELIESCKELL